MGKPRTLSKFEIASYESTRTSFNQVQWGTRELDKQGNLLLEENVINESGRYTVD